MTKVDDKKDVGRLMAIMEAVHAHARECAAGCECASQHLGPGMLEMKFTPGCSAGRAFEVELTALSKIFTRERAQGVN